jgi:glycosyltransferase involved in cell wall biosynthesis
MDRDVTVLITGIPPRIGKKLDRAIASAWAQTHQPEALIVNIDWEKRGAGANRNRGLVQAQTTWVAFLDDDDEFQPHHLRRCLDAAEASGADVVVPWFRVQGGSDPFPGNRACGVPASGPMPAFPVTVLARREVARRARFTEGLKTIAGGGEEYHYFTLLRDREARFEMIPDETWIYHHGGNTSGLPTW